MRDMNLSIRQMRADISELFNICRRLNDVVFEISRSSGKRHKVLVTGGAGFIGSHVVALLIKRGYKVVIVDNLRSNNHRFVNKKAKFYKLDILSDKLEGIFRIEKPDFVVHAAAQVSVIESLKNPGFDARVNINGTINVLEQCRKYKVKKIIFLSSSAVYGNPLYLPIDEKHPIKPISPYGISKHTAEHYLYQYYVNYGLDYLILRLANVYGPRQGVGKVFGVVPSFIYSFLNNKPIKINGDGSQTRDFVFVDDVADAIIKAIERPTIKKIINIGSKREISVSRIYKLLRVFFNHDKEVEFNPPIEGEIKRIYMDYTAAKKELGWKPKIKFEEGLSKTIIWFKKFNLNNKKGKRSIS